MDDQNQDFSFDRKGALKAMGVAFTIALLGIGILGWQYRKLEQEKIPALEEKIERQEKEMAKKAAQDILDKFMQSRLNKNKAQAMLYLTESAAQQKIEEKFTLINQYSSYEILNSEKLAESKFRFAVKIYGKDQLTDFVEVIILTKILDKYYIDSIELAG